MLQGSLGVGAGSDEDEAAWGAAVAAVPQFSLALQTSFCPSLGQPEWAVTRTLSANTASQFL